MTTSSQSVSGALDSIRRAQVRSSRAKTKPGEDAGRADGSALCPTEDAARRRFAAARTAPGPTGRIQGSAEFTGQNGRLETFHPKLITGACKKHGKSHPKKAHPKKPSQGKKGK